MYLVRSLRTFIGTNAERTAAGLGAFLAGDEFIETDTNNKYLHDGMAWVKTAVDGSGYLPLSGGTLTGGLVVNSSGGDNDTTIQGSTATKLGVFDAGLDAFQVGTTVAGDIADFRDSGIVFNNSESDRDFRIAGNGVTNGVYWDAGNSRLILGDDEGTAPFHIKATTGSAGIELFRAESVNEGGYFSVADGGTPGFFPLFEFASAGSIAGGVLRGRIETASDTYNALTAAIIIDGLKGTGLAALSNANLLVVRRGTGTSVSAVFTIGPTGGVMVGSPTGGNKGAGTINAVAIYDDNVLLTDYVFEPDYPLLTIDAMTVFYQSNKHLPTIPGRDEWEKNGKFSLGKLANHLWETIEVQAIYISQLHERLMRLEHGK